MYVHQSDKLVRRWNRRVFGRIRAAKHRLYVCVFLLNIKTGKNLCFSSRQLRYCVMYIHTRCAPASSRAHTRSFSSPLKFFYFIRAVRTQESILAKCWPYHRCCLRLCVRTNAVWKKKKRQSKPIALSCDEDRTRTTLFLRARIALYLRPFIQSFPLVPRAVVRISFSVFPLKKKKKTKHHWRQHTHIGHRGNGRKLNREKIESFSHPLVVTRALFASRGVTCPFLHISWHKEVAKNPKNARQVRKAAQSKLPSAR